MKDKIVVVGSGASAVHFALSVLQKGYEVHMLDVGHQKPRPVNPSNSFNDLKAGLDDPAAYFLGSDYRGALLPGSDKEYYGIPPGKDYVFNGVENFSYRTNGFAPLFSFAQGGLAETWTGGVYPFNDDELSDFPFNYRDIEPFYAEVANRIGISGDQDDLTRFYPLHAGLLPPLQLDEHSTRLLSKYQEGKNHLNKKFGCYVGRSRVATLSLDKNGRKKCSYLGRCLWGCPSNSLYTPSITLQDCLKFSAFKYHPGLYVTYFKFDRKRRISKVVAESVNEKRELEFEVDRLVLAAGALSSTKIFMESICRDSGENIKLSGLMDNRQILMPFINLKMVGKRFNPESYQYHQVAMGLKSNNAKEYIHGQITTLKTALIHPIVQNLPLDLRSGIFLMQHVHAALGLVNLNFHDTRRSGNYVSLERDQKNTRNLLFTHYTPADLEKNFLAKAMKRTKKALKKLGCFVPPGMTHVRPMGASVHYAGTLPMSEGKADYTTNEACLSNDFENLFIVDGSTFPFLPAKNITFTLMANAARVAENYF